MSRVRSEEYRIDRMKELWNVLRGTRRSSWVLRVTAKILWGVAVDHE